MELINGAQKFKWLVSDSNPFQIEDWLKSEVIGIWSWSKNFLKNIKRLMSQSWNCQLARQIREIFRCIGSLLFGEPPGHEVIVQSRVKAMQLGLRGN